MINLFITLLTINFINCEVLNDTDVIEYLKTFGFINESDPNALSNIEESLINFQEYYDLPLDGKLNNETIKLIQTPRCGVVDNPFEFRKFGTKWNKSELFWYFPLSNDNSRMIATKAFNIWENVSNLNFKYRIINPDIVISFQRVIYDSDGTYHKNHPKCKKGKCFYKLNTIGGILGHAFPPKFNVCTEIHLDITEDWYYDLDIAPIGKINLYTTLIHEIGHTLGLGHSSVKNSIMFPYYINEFKQLSRDDILGIENLYGVISSTTSTSTTQVPKIISDPPDLCKIIPENFLITSNHHFYIFYKEWVWILRLGENKYRQPRKISDYLPFSTITHIYQRIHGDILIVSNKLLYLVDFPNLIIKNGWDGRSLENLGIKSINKINTIFSTYSGKTYIFYDNYYYLELNECTFKPINYGIISERFPGISSNVTSTFKYINGNLYFFKNFTYYEFNEFTNNLVRAGKFDLSLFNINCPNKNILEQLRNLLSRLITTDF